MFLVTYNVNIWFLKPYILSAFSTNNYIYIIRGVHKVVNKCSVLLTLDIYSFVDIVISSFILSS